MAGILVADDNPNVRQLLRTFIETHTGLKVCGEAGDGAEAIEKARDLQPDVVVLDLAMPLLNGIETVSVLKRFMPHAKVVLFTMQVDGLGHTLASAIGIDFILSKEQSINKLAEYLRVLVPVDVATLSEGGQATEKGRA